MKVEIFPRRAGLFCGLVVSPHSEVSGGAYRAKKLVRLHASIAYHTDQLSARLLQKSSCAYRFSGHNRTLRSFRGAKELIVGDIYSFLPVLV